MSLIPLHTRSHYSPGAGTATVEELAVRAAAAGMPAIGLTDVETLAGQIRFHDACAEAHVRAITGVELRSGFGPGSTGHHEGRLVLLARDEAGYASLCRIVSRRRTAFPGRTTCDPVASLEAGSSGLYVLTDDAQVMTRLLRAETVARENLRLLLVRPRPARRQQLVIDASRDTGVPLVADVEVEMLDPEDRPVHHLVGAIRKRRTVSQVYRGETAEQAHGSLGLASGDLFADLPHAVREARSIAEACTLDLLRPRIVPPRLPGVDAAEVVPLLRSMCNRALTEGRERGSFHGPAYDMRLEHELGTITRLGFSEYFLAVAEIVRGAASLGIATAGRGSAAGSLVAHLLGITGIDPVAADLLFERFLHDRREGPPDIDLDVASVRRDVLNAWVMRRFGRDRVAGIATYATHRARSAVREGLRAIGIARRTIDLVVRRIDPGEASGEDEAVLVEKVLAESSIPAIRDAAPLIRRLVGVPAHLSAHPGGIIIGDGPLEDLVPLERSPKGTIVTQYDLRAVERAGFLKIDLLGNHFLSELQETFSRLPPDTAIPTDDDDTWKTLDRGDTLGCFQVESPAVRSVLRRLPVRRFPDLVAALAVVRPGAAANASKERFIRRARGEEPFDALEILGGIEDGLLESLRDRLERTFGVLLYDEDIIRLLATVGGMDYASADSVRSAIVAAGDRPGALAKLGKTFEETARSSGAEPGVAERAWASAVAFASYSFAEAHAASHARLAWQAAWLRTHVPVHFACALLNHHRGLYPLRTTAAEIVRWGVRLARPSVNRSDLPSTVESATSGVVRVGLAAIKGLTRRTAARIHGGRPFRDLTSLLSRARPSRAELVALLLSGACDELTPLSEAGYPFVHEAMLEGLRGRLKPEALRQVVDRFTGPAPGRDIEALRQYRALVRVRNEIEYMDMHLSGHPMALLRGEADRLGCIRSGALEGLQGRYVRFAGLLSATRRVATREGEMRFLTLEDEDGLIEAVLFPGANVHLGSRLTTPGPYLVGGSVRETDGDLHLVLAELLPFHERR